MQPHNDFIFFKKMNQITAFLCCGISKSLLVIMFLLIVAFGFKSSYALNITIPNSLAKNVSISIRSDNGKIIYSYSGDTPRLIASNVKLFTTFIALERLHPDFHWVSRLYLLGHIDKKTKELDGNLYLIGSGDPYFSRSDLLSMFAKLKELGIDRISGDIILNGSIFNTTTKYSLLHADKFDIDTITPHGVMIDQNINKLDFMLSQVVNGFNHNARSKHDHYNYKQESDAVMVNSDLFGYTINNDLHLTQDDTRYKNFSCSNLIEDGLINVEISNNSNNSNEHKLNISGVYPKKCGSQKFSLYLLNNSQYNDMEVRRALYLLNIKLLGIVNSNNSSTQDTANLTLVNDNISPSLSEYLIRMNKFSNNLAAQSLLLSLGAYLSPNLNTYKSSLEIYNNTLKEYGLDLPQTHIENGAGLSRHEYFSTNLITRVLLYSANSTFAPELKAGLPIPGEEGTLSKHPFGLINHAHIKTGTLNDSKSYSGYFCGKDSSNKSNCYIVSFVLNNVASDELYKFQQFNQLIKNIVGQLVAR